MCARKRAGGAIRSPLRGESGIEIASRGCARRASLTPGFIRAPLRGEERACVGHLPEILLHPVFTSSCADPIEPAGKALLRPGCTAELAALRARVQYCLLRVIAEHAIGRGSHHVGNAVLVDSPHEIRVRSLHLWHTKELDRALSIWFGRPQLLQASGSDTLGSQFFFRQQVREMPVDVLGKSIQRGVLWNRKSRRGRWIV